MDQLLIFQTLLDSFKDLLSGGASSTTYLILAFVPICILVAIREIWCWFLKQNKLVSRMEKIEKHLKTTNNLLEKISSTLIENQTTPYRSTPEFKPSKPQDYSKPQEEERSEPKSLGERKYTI